MATNTQTSLAQRPPTSIFAPSTNQTMKREATTSVPAPRIRQYKEFLTPALHRRFVNAAALSLVLCWVDATYLSTSFLSRSGLLWSWFPFGPTGIRALLLFAPCLAVFIVRVANMHAGVYNASSDAAVLMARFSGLSGIGNAVHTVGWYVWSGWFFGEVFIWSQSAASPELGWVDYGQAYERPRLNENPIFLRCLYLVLSLAQATLHLLRDYDLINLENEEHVEHRHNPFVAYLGVPASMMERLPVALRRLAEQSGAILNHIMQLTLVGTIMHLPLYYLLFRRSAWEWSYSIVGSVFSKLPESAPPTGLVHLTTLINQALSTSFMLATLWEVSNVAFTAIVTQPPLKKGVPFTSEMKDSRGAVVSRSRDPNASLLTGLRSKKPVPKAFAFWELYIICTSFEARRKTIYTEVDRAGGNTWSQICKLCLAEISAVKTNVEAAIDPATYKAKLLAEAEKKKQQDALAAETKERSVGLRKIADQTVQTNANLFAKSRRDNSLGDLTRSIGQNPGAANPVSPHVRKAIQWTADAVLDQADQQRLAAANVSSIPGLLGRILQSQYTVRFLQTPLGAPFRQTLQRRLSSAVFGRGESGKGNFIHAVKILERLIMCSLQEDQYGSVQTDVAEVVRTLTATVLLMEKFVNQARPHWSDVERPRTSAERGEIALVLSVLKQSLEQIVLGFGEYADALGLSLKEIREANEAAVIPPTRASIEAAPERRTEPVAERDRRTERPAVRERRTDGYYREGLARRPEMEKVERSRRHRE